jgi:protein involved in polysaccharide export with SLBB domain
VRVVVRDHQSQGGSPLVEIDQVRVVRRRHAAPEERDAHVALAQADRAQPPARRLGETARLDVPVPERELVLATIQVQERQHAGQCRTQRPTELKLVLDLAS